MTAERKALGCCILERHLHLHSRVALLISASQEVVDALDHGNGISDPVGFFKINVVEPMGRKYINEGNISALP